ncbi:fibrobacter succinogenes major paralogous domain-containing protein [Crocinitomicaceae bacterium]|nr:fibrobacter succinogenes major paralogous domain-containing protein [Crocinitomicaceae bacterium]
MRIILYILLFQSIVYGQAPNNFNSVKIGNQLWSSENLNTITFRNGDSIREVHNTSEWNHAFENQVPCWIYNYVQDNKGHLRLGKIYNWYAVNDERGLAPIGWHIATDKEWSILLEFVGDPNAYHDKSSWSGGGIAQKKLKSTFGWIFPYSYSGSGNGTNESGFNVIPAGNFVYSSYNKTGFDSQFGGYTSFWTSNQIDSEYIWTRGFGWDNLKEANRTECWIKNGCYVRCVKD